MVPTLYEILGIKPPKVVDGFKQDPIDGVSMAYSFANASGANDEERLSFSTTMAAVGFITMAGLRARSAH